MNQNLQTSLNKKWDRMSTSSLSAGETALVGIFILFLLSVLKIAADLLVPLTLTVLLSFVFEPVVHFLKTIHIPKQIGAGIVVLGIVAVLVSAMIFLSQPAQEWLDKSPYLLRRIESKLQTIKKPIKQVQEAAQKIQNMAEIDEKKGQIIVKTETKKLFQAIFSATPELLGFLLLSVVLLYFLLFSGEELAHYVLQLIFMLTRHKPPNDLSGFIQKQISLYLITITIVNVCLGVISTGVFAVIGLPNPILWGTMAAILNYVPYIGALCMAVIILAVAFVSFDSMAYSLLAPGIYLLLTTIEGQIVTPQILGSRFSMNPLLIFLFIILWAWLWGYTGALLALPLLMTVKIILESLDLLAVQKKNGSPV